MHLDVTSFRKLLSAISEKCSYSLEELNFAFCNINDVKAHCITEMFCRNKFQSLNRISLKKNVISGEAMQGIMINFISALNPSDKLY